jgi:hypothetical protein
MVSDEGSRMGEFSRRRFLATGGLAVAVAIAGTRRTTAAATPWVDRDSYGPFQCVAAFSLASLDGVDDDLARLEQELQRTLALPPARDPIEVFMLADEASHRAMLAELFPRVPYRRALYVQREGRAAVYAFRHPDLAIDLRHECTHALIHASLPEVPLWLDEGLAEYFEMPQPERAFGHPSLAAVRWNLRLGMHRTIESLEGADDLSQMGGVEYRFSWAWVHFMLHGPVAAHRALVRQLADLGRGKSETQMSARLRAAIPQLDERMVQHFEKWRREPGELMADARV